MNIKGQKNIVIERKRVASELVINLEYYQFADNFAINRTRPEMEVKILVKCYF